MDLAYLNNMEGELITRFRRYKVEYSVVGGHAVLCYSSPERGNGQLRTLGDLDLLIDCSEDNLRRACDALATLNVPLTLGQLTTALRAGTIINLTGGYRTQLFPAIQGIDSHEVFRSAEHVYSRFGEVSVISKAHLIQAKKASGRPKDLEDVQALEASAQCIKAV